MYPGWQSENPRSRRLFLRQMQTRGSYMHSGAPASLGGKDKQATFIQLQTLFPTRGYSPGTIRRSRRGRDARIALFYFEEFYIIPPLLFCLLAVGLSEAFRNPCIYYDTGCIDRQKRTDLQRNSLFIVVDFSLVCLLWCQHAECALVQLRSIRLQPLRSVGLIVP